MRTKVLMTFVYILTAIFAISMVIFIFSALQPGKYELAVVCSTVGYVCAVIIAILSVIKGRRDKQDSKKS